MAYVADLHIHSRFSRACSRDLNIPNLAKWAKYKGIDLMGTGDSLHPLWQTELKSVLKDAGNGTYDYNNTKFVMTTEVACIYTEKGKVHRIHILLFLPSIEASFKLSEVLSKKGFNLSSDGRPIFGLSTKQLCEIVFTNVPNALIVPAHCVLPSTMVHTVNGVQEIQNIQVGQLVYTHQNRKRKVTKIINHKHKGKLYNIQPWYFSLGLEATSEHPFLAFKTKKCPSTGDTCLPTSAHKKRCRHKFFEGYNPRWIMAKDLKVSDIIVYPRFTNTTPKPSLDLGKISAYSVNKGLIYTGGTRGTIFNQKLPITEDLCRLIGYYLAEGWVTSKGEVGFCFNIKEESYIQDIRNLFQDNFGISHSRVYRRSRSNGVELIFASKLLSTIFATLFYSQNPFKAKNKVLPDWALHLPTNLQAQILLGWWRGDRGYTTSRQLMNQIKIICLRLGIIPSITLDTAADHLNRGNHEYQGRVVQASTDLFYFSNLAFFDDPHNLMGDFVFAKFRRKISRRHGWIDNNYAYLPIRKITTRDYKDEVFNLEVEEDNSYITEFAAVHNCWTPWFSLYGSESGYDHFSDCFGEFSDQIYGVETGLSSEPAMNWRIKDLDRKSIVSFSDAHSLPRLGREVTIFNGQPTFKDLKSALETQNIVGTIEFFPEEGKYHYSGHRNCGVVYGPEELKEKGEICPVCKRRLTVGVMQRVEDLSSRENQELRIMNQEGVIKSEAFPEKPGFRMLVQLEEILAEALSSTVASQKVKNEYIKLVTTLDPELKLLTKTPIESIAKISGDKVAEGIKRVREGKLKIEPGYDNTYGKVKIFGDEEEKAKEQQISMF